MAIIKELVPLGIGGALAVLIFTIHRSDMLKLLGDFKEDRNRFIEDGNRRTDILITLIRENTTATTILTELVRNSFSRANNFSGYKE